jgi:hypothetical protein
MSSSAVKYKLRTRINAKFGVIFNHQFSTAIWTKLVVLRKLVVTPTEWVFFHPIIPFFVHVRGNEFAEVLGSAGREK